MHAIPELHLVDVGESRPTRTEPPCEIAAEPETRDRDENDVEPRQDRQSNGSVAPARGRGGETHSHRRAEGEQHERERRCREGTGDHGCPFDVAYRAIYGLY